MRQKRCRKKKSRERDRKRRQIKGNLETQWRGCGEKGKQTEGKWRKVIPPMSVFCFLDLTQPQAVHIPRPSRYWNLQLERACLLIKHMWTCRGMGRDRVLRTASLCIQAHTCMRRNNSIQMQVQCSC